MILASYIEGRGIIPRQLNSITGACILPCTQAMKNSLAAIYGNIGIVYKNLGDFEQARQAYEKQLDSLRKGTKD